MPVSDFNRMLEIFGVDNYKIIVGSVREDWEGGPFQRGQLLLSPAALESIQEFLNEKGK
jgi:hypothetical protein